MKENVDLPLANEPKVKTSWVQLYNKQAAYDGENRLKILPLTPITALCPRSLTSCVL
jgi:hypothetical protein